MYPAPPGPNLASEPAIGVSTMSIHGITVPMIIRTTLRQAGNNTGIEVPPEVVAELGGGKRPAVNVTVNGYAYRSTIAPMGGTFMIPFSADRRAATGIAGGSEIEVELTLDTAPRTVEVPAELAAALDAAGLTERFGQLAFTHQKEHVRAVADAKTDATRQRRIAAVVARLQS